MAPLLEVRQLGRKFPGVVALDGVDLTVEAGEVHVLLGENGAGKSTLIKILAGVQPPSTGQILLDGTPVSLSSPRAAHDVGISTVFQELSLVPSLTVAENLLLGRLPTRSGIVNRSRIPDLARDALARIGADIPLGARADSLTRSAQQLVEIAKGLMGSARLLILDEPTASLGEQESEHLLALVQSLAEQGIGIIYITHRLKEIARIGHRVTVLRDGRRVGGVGPDEIGDSDRLVELMTGRRPENLYPRSPRQPGAELLTIESLSADELVDTSMSFRAGEIVGIAGLLGSGKSALGRACFGLNRVDSGRISVRQKALSKLNPTKAIRHGIVYYPSDRKHQGLALNQPLSTNITLGSLRAAGVARWGFLNRRRERELARRHVERMSIRPAETDRRTDLYSGGNQQKAVLARGLLHHADIHIFDEPTVGIDVNAKIDVYRVMDDLAAAGKAVVLISSDLPEVLGMSDRVYVMHEGRVSAHLEGEQIDENTVLTAFFSSPELENNGAMQ
ncbi:sugar ABC transporter ATP-binding protein [Mycobacterium sp. NAZ190054]|uniref:sugar ABC transporter ATP-binding protein n=1 Tax=Mycobacterium sp. NAZ190054 TaxID=1747766 RepID=UPI0007941695|nr:sugar ABC transporter ATP-binding protein [Mycobacterium sp. NAZ190054]KWX68622.1 sugar ABC transporter ATP-binding protein [Mycobacterium sp. NAZ190054]